MTESKSVGGGRRERVFEEVGGEQECSGEGEGEQVLREGGKQEYWGREERVFRGEGRRERALGEGGEQECWGERRERVLGEGVG